MSLVATANLCIDAPGLTNLREVGSYPIDSIRYLRPRLLYRSEAPTRLTAAGIDALAELSLATVVDLRSDPEVELNPATGLPGVQMIRVPISERLDDGGSILHQIRSGQLRTFGAGDLTVMYCRLLDNYAPQFGAAMSTLADPLRLPALVHCAVGKDRTGLLVGLLLNLLGVPAAHIMADYAMTAVRRAYRRTELAPELAEVGLTDVDVDGLFSSDPCVLGGALRHVVSSYGSVQNYLRQAGGVPTTVIEALRMNFVQEPL